MLLEGDDIREAWLLKVGGGGGAGWGVMQRAEETRHGQMADRRARQKERPV